jgi:hypothetical protein
MIIKWAWFIWARWKPPPLLRLGEIFANPIFLLQCGCPCRVRDWFLGFDRGDFQLAPQQESVPGFRHRLVPNPKIIFHVLRKQTFRRVNLRFRNCPSSWWWQIHEFTWKREMWQPYKTFFPKKTVDFFSLHDLFQKLSDKNVLYSGASGTFFCTLPCTWQVRPLEHRLVVCGDSLLGGRHLWRLQYVYTMVSGRGSKLAGAGLLPKRW